MCVCVCMCVYTCMLCSFNMPQTYITMTHLAPW